MELVTNQKTKLSDLLEKYLKDSKKAHICVAYADKKGLDLLKSFNQEPKTEISIITGTDYYLSDLDYLEEQGFNYRVYRKEGFHPKIYIFFLEGGKNVCIIGSSNLTEEGLEENIESNLVFKGNQRNPLVVSCLSFFNQAWRYSRKPSPDFRKSYGEKREKREQADSWWK